jgi:hypothetical protein
MACYGDSFTFLYPSNGTAAPALLANGHAAQREF